MVQPRTQIVYVNHYDPYVVYGPWWWPHYPPVFWRPWVPRPVFVAHGFFYSKPDWHRHHVHVAHRPVHVRAPQRRSGQMAAHQAGRGEGARLRQQAVRPRARIAAQADRAEPHAGGERITQKHPQRQHHAGVPTQRQQHAGVPHAAAAARRSSYAAAAARGSSYAAAAARRSSAQGQQHAGVQRGHSQGGQASAAAMASAAATARAAVTARAAAISQGGHGRR